MADGGRTYSFVLDRRSERKYRSVIVKMDRKTRHAWYIKLTTNSRTADSRIEGARPRIVVRVSRLFDREQCGCGGRSDHPGALKNQQHSEEKCNQRDLASSEDAHWLLGAVSILDRRPGC